MIYLWGAGLAAGILLIVSPWMWPPRVRVRQEQSGRLRSLLVEAGYQRVSPMVFLASVGIGSAVVAAVIWVLLPVASLTLVAWLAAAIAPFSWLRSRRARLIRTRQSLWPDICDLLIASVRAGMSLPDAVASLSAAAPMPVRAPFVQFAGDLAASGHFESSVSRLKERLADPVADRIIETLRMARQVGGTELTPVLRSLAASVRADALVRAEVDARQSWVRGAAILGVIAPWVILSLLALRPEGARAYASPGGMVLVLGGAIVSFFAYRVMIRLGRLPEPRRWTR